MNILLIEDNEDHKELIGDYLEDIFQDNLEIDWQTRLALGIERLNTQSYDLMFCDLSLPDSPITQTVDYLRQFKTSVPVVVLTSLSDENTVKTLINQGVQDYIAKEDLSARLLHRVCITSIERKQYEQRLQKSLHEKELMLSEIYHRVKNNLQIIHSLMSLQKDYLDNHTAESVLKECEHRVGSMALVHQLSYQENSFESVKQLEVIDSLIQNIMMSYPEVRDWLKIDLQIQDLSLPINISIPIGLIINEAMLSIIGKTGPHQKSKITLALSKTVSNHYNLVVQTDCAHFLSSFDEEAPGSMCQMLILCLCDQIEANCRYCSDGRSELAIEFTV